MQPADWIVIAIYFGIVAWIGVATSRRVAASEDFFMAGRRFRKTFMVFFAFGAGTHTDQAVSVAARSYTAGLSGIWLQWIWLFATPFYWVIAPVFRRMRAITTGDYFELRYGRSVAALFALVGVLQLVVNMATMLKGSGAMITAVSSGAIGELAAILFTTLLFTAYGIAGGLAAAVVTDLLQGVLTIVLSFLVLPIALHQLGGLDGLRAQLDRPELFSLVAPGDITAFYIAVIALNGLVGIVTQPHIMANCAAGRTELDNRIGFTYGNMLKRVCTVAWTFTGLAAIALYPGLAHPHEIDQTYGLMARDLLPLLAPGLLGLFLASMLAAVMSSCDAWMISSSALFTENLYRPFVAPGRSDRHYLVVGRVVSGLIVAAAVLYALTLESVISGLEMFWRVQAMMGIPFWVGLVWRRATPAAAWVSTLSAFAVAIAVSNPMPGWFDVDAWATARLPAWAVTDGSIRLPAEMLAYLGVGLVTMVGTSWLTRAVDAARLDRLFRALHTPVQDDEGPPAAPFAVPEGSAPSPTPKIFDHPDFELRWPSRQTWVGFVAVWIGVGVLIAAVAWLARA